MRIHVHTCAYMCILALLAGCTSLIPPPPWAGAAAEYESLSLEYESLANQLVTARTNGTMDGNQWAAFSRIQETVGTLSFEIDSLFTEWESTGRKPDRFDGTFGELRDEMVSLRKLVARITNPSIGRSTRTVAIRKAA